MGDPYLPFEETHLHPSKRFASLDTRHLQGAKIGVPLQFGWAASRLGEIGTQIEYVQHSTGKFCDNDGHPFVFESDDFPEDCQARCTEEPRCTFYTAFTEHGWCQ